MRPYRAFQNLSNQNDIWSIDFFANISQKRDEIKYDYIDTLSQFDPSKKNCCLNDGAHPSKYGHSTIAEMLYEEIISNIKSNSDIR